MQNELHKSHEQSWDKTIYCWPANCSEEMQKGSAASVGDIAASAAWDAAEKFSWGRMRDPMAEYVAGGLLWKKLNPCSRSQPQHAGG